MKRLISKIKRLISDNDGAASVEYALLLAVFGLPMIFIFRILINALVAYFEMASTIISLPFL